MPRPFFHTAALHGHAWTRRVWQSSSALIAAAVLVLLSLDMPFAG